MNLAENASAGNWELLASFRLIDVNLIKLTRGIGHLRRGKVIKHSLLIEVRSSSGIGCPSLRVDFRNIDGGTDRLQEGL